MVQFQKPGKEGGGTVASKEWYVLHCNGTYFEFKEDEKKMMLRQKILISFFTLYLSKTQEKQICKGKEGKSTHLIDFSL